ncbi:MAG: protein-glutamate O-methyltransferase [Spirochaetes bacterium]|nr:protein-glutamate O-methyltransferase [Spirochaetota bacterium]
MEFVLTEEDFKIFKDFIYEKSGIYFSDINKAVLENRLYEIMLKNKYSSLKEYYNILLKDEAEVRNFLDKVTTNLTKFFRNEPQFDALKNVVIKEIVKRNKENGINNIRIWSAGCSSGEEPYTIAMIFAEELGFNSGIEVKIVASDISLKSLLIAKEGFYSEEKVKDVPQNYLNKYFQKVGDGYRIIDELKKMIKFDYHNLKHDFPYNDLDIIFCRNVIIYFDQKTQHDVVTKFYNLLRDYGYLFLGHSESLFGMNTKFKFRKVENAICYIKDERK